MAVTKKEKTYSFTPAKISEGGHNPRKDKGRTKKWTFIKANLNATGIGKK